MTPAQNPPPPLEEVDLLRPELAAAWTQSGLLRRDWRVNLPNETVGKIVLLSLGLGGWGVISGFAVFVLLHESVAHHPLLVFFAALIVAAVVAMLTEYLRERIEHGGTHSHAAVHERPSLLAKLPVTILMLGLFELFISAWHAASEMGQGFVVDAGLLILGPELSGRLNAPWAVAALAALWVIEGAFLSAVLAYTLTNQSISTRPYEGRGVQKVARALRPSLRCAWIGGISGGLAGAVGLLATVVLVRMLAAVSLILFEPRQWLALVQSAPHTTGVNSGPLRHLLFGPIEFLSGLLTRPDWRPLGPIAAAVLVVGLVAVCVKNKIWWPLWLLAVGLFVVMMVPLAGSIGTVLTQAWFAALIWMGPGICLGASVPLLKGPSSRPRIWGVAAFLAAAALGRVAFLVQTEELKTLVVGLTFVVTLAGVIFWRGGELKTYWPFAAIVLTAYVGLLTAAQRATFYGVLSELSKLTAAPASPATRPQPTWLDRALQLKEMRSTPVVASSFGQLDLYRTNVPTFPLGRSPQSGSLSSEMLRGAGITLPPQGMDPVRPAGTPARPPMPSSPEQALITSEERGRKLINDTKALMQAQATDADARRTVFDQQHEALRRQREELKTSLNAYLKTALDRAGTPDTWPDRKAQIALQELAILGHQLHARAGQLHALGHPATARISPAALFELSVTGSLAFWITVGLLVGWSERATETVLVNDHGRPKCFWGRGEFAAYHDTQHGKRPANDRELFERLALALLARNAVAKVGELKKECLDLDPIRLAALSAAQSHTLSAGLRTALTWDAWADGPRLIALAQKFLRLRSKLSATADSLFDHPVLLTDWTRRAAESPQKLVAHLQSELALRPTMPLGTFLQSVGLVEGAHFKGCCCAGTAGVPPAMV